MESILTLIANFGFPIVVSAYLLVRIEGKLEKLTAAITDLDQVVVALKVGAFAEP
ncbi:MAG: YvrJ family protein [Coprothermobacterota bacterium]|nr:YvrJ family protein [Coprothermobacterota bacterium]